jgi:2,3-bisphosphoglycerate-independent phosphoglycerate mutase
MTVYRSDIPEERDQARAEAQEAYRERITWLAECGACGQFEPWDPRTGQFLRDCPRRANGT